MGEAKRRGTYEERVAAATPRVPKPDRQYRPRMPLYTSALLYLWQQFKVGIDDKTIAEFRAEAVAEQTRLRELRAAREVAENPEGWLAKNTQPVEEYEQLGGGGL
jgi:hypothetical protein